ncbi:MAG: pteridine reductase [Planctomycetota bacterium]|jgi:pteridine reductase
MNGKNDSGDARPGSIALITGGARRLGAAMARTLADHGWDIVIHHRSSAKEAESLAEELRGLGRRAWTIEADLSSPGECKELVPRAVELAGSLSALVNNASIFPCSHFTNFEAQAVHDNVQLHAIAPALLAREFAKLASARHVLNMLDSKITGPDDEHFAYHLSKQLLASLTSIMARELAPQIAVNALAPGAMLPAAGVADQKFADLANTVPMKKTGTPADIASAAVFLLGSQFITGQVLFVDGGRHLEGQIYG